MYYISLGANCHSAWNLKDLNLRKESLPFDWMAIIDNILTYPTLLIKNNFNNYLNNIIYFKDQNQYIDKSLNQYTISNNYKYAIFFHHNLITTPENIKKLKKRANNFLKIINNKNNKCIFFLGILYKYFDSHFEKILNDIPKFIEVMNNKCKYVLLIYIIIDNNHKFDYKFEDLKFDNIIFAKYYRNKKQEGQRGDLNKFKSMINIAKEKINKL